MIIQRRLLHVQPGAVRPSVPSQTERISPLNSLSPSGTPRVSLSADSMRKVGARDWTRPSNGTTGNRSKLPPTRAEQEEAQKRVTTKFYRDAAKEKLKEALTKRAMKLPPIPALHAVHCMISPVPKSFTTNDVARLVKANGTTHTELAEATRIYDHNLLEQQSYLLRFLHPSHLRDFLLRIHEIKVFDEPLTAKLFHEDISKSHLRPGTILPRGITPLNALRHREEYLRDFSGQSHPVMVSGIPRQATLGMMTYYALVTLENWKFEWAHEWRNRPGEGTEFEPNIVPVAAGRLDPDLARWLFMLKDEESAWRFARHMHLSHFKEERYGQDFLMKARVIE